MSVLQIQVDSAHRMKKVVLIGDSIRLHYQPLVARALANEAVVWGPEENCRTSSDILANAKEWILDQSPDIVHLNCGLHDLRIDPGFARQQIPVEQYAANLAEIFDWLGNGDQRTLIRGTITPLSKEQHQRSQPSRRYESDVALYNATALELASRHGMRINDLHRSVLDAGANKLLSADGVHFSEEGYRVLADAVVASIRGCLDGTMRKRSSK